MHSQRAVVVFTALVVIGNFAYGYRLEGDKIVTDHNVKLYYKKGQPLTLMYVAGMAGIPFVKDDLVSTRTAAWGPATEKALAENKLIFGALGGESEEVKSHDGKYEWSLILNDAQKVWSGTAAEECKNEEKSTGFKGCVKFLGNIFRQLGTAVEAVGGAFNVPGVPGK